MRTFVACQVLIVVILSLLTGPAQAVDEKPGAVYPVAILPIEERGREVKDLGAKATDLLFAKLIAKPELYLVDRAELNKILEEQELNLSGAVNPAQATKVGQLTGAKILVTGSVLQVDSNLYLVVKLIGTETSRVVGASVKGNVNDHLDNLVGKLADEVASTITQRAEELVAKPFSLEDHVAALKKKLGDGKRPAVMVTVAERHVGQAAFDPAAETEITMFCQDTGFPVVDAKEGSKKDADVLITGGAFSEFAMRRGNLVSVKAHVEIKAVNRLSGKVLATDRQTALVVDLSERIAAKTALQQASAALAGRLLPKLLVQP